MRLFHLKREAVTIEPDIREKDEALERLIRLVCDVYHIDDCDTVYRLIIDREGRLSTGIGLEVAVPHCRIGNVKRIVAGAMLLPNGIDYNSVDGLPVKLIILLLSPESDIRGHLACLSSISHTVSDERLRGKLLSRKEESELFDIIRETIQG